MFISTPFARPANQQNNLQQTQYSLSPGNKTILTKQSKSIDYCCFIVSNRNFGMQQQHQQQQQQIDTSNICYSAKHAGLYLHVSRMLRLVWKKKCIQFKENICSSNISFLDCAAILDDLYAIRSFIESMPMNNPSGKGLNKNACTHDRLVCTNNDLFVVGFLQNFSNQSTLGGATPNGQKVNSQQAGNVSELANAEEKKSINALAHFISKKNNKNTYKH